MPSTSLYYCVYAIRSTDQVLHYRGMVSQTDETLVGLLRKLKHRAGITATSLYRVGVAYQEVWHYREVAWRHRQICDFSSVRIGHLHTDGHTGQTTVTSLPRVDRDGEACQEA